MASTPKRNFPLFNSSQSSPSSKKIKVQTDETKDDDTNIPNVFKPESTSTNKNQEQLSETTVSKKSHAPLAEQMRPQELNDYIGQTHLIGPKTLLYDLLQNDTIPSMILWGPPGCGKTSLVNVIMQTCKKMTEHPVKFIKLSATTASINDVRKAVTEAQTHSKQGRRTVVFMDEIHRFNKLQQDIFLPHVEAGTFILIGATTENPSSGLNSALLSRCRVFILQKLTKNELISILCKAIKSIDGEIISTNKKNRQKNTTAQFFIEKEVINWLAEVCDGDARVALGGLEIAIQSKMQSINTNKTVKINLNDIKKGLECTQNLTDKKTNEVRHMHNALHHSIIGDDDNAAVYWLARIMETREDPVYIARKLVRIASEEIGLADEEALSMAVHTMHACQMIGMPECDVLLAQCVIYMARAEKSREIITALRKCQDVVENQKGPQPKVPLFIKDRSGQGKLRATLGVNYKDLEQQENLRKCHLPEGLENANFYDDENA